MDRFKEIDHRLGEVSALLLSLGDEKRVLENERAILKASSVGFRIGDAVEWDGRQGAEQGTIRCIWPSHHASGWLLGVEQDPDLALTHVSKGKKPRSVRRTE